MLILSSPYHLSETSNIWVWLHFLFIQWDEYILWSQSLNQKEKQGLISWSHLFKFLALIILLGLFGFHQVMTLIWLVQVSHIPLAAKINYMLIIDEFILSLIFPNSVLTVPFLLSWHWMEVYYKSISCVFFFILYLPIIKIMIFFYFNRLLLGIIYCGIHWGSVHLQQWLRCREFGCNQGNMKILEKNLRERYLWLVNWSYPAQII